MDAKEQIRVISDGIINAVKDLEKGIGEIEAPKDLITSRVNPVLDSLVASVQHFIGKLDAVRITPSLVDEQVKLFCHQAIAIGLPAKILIRDSDRKFSGGVDQVLADEGVLTKRLTPVSPNLNACAERWAQSVQHECLNHFVILGLRHMTYLIREYTDYYNTLRPHQSKGNVPLTGTGPPPKRTLADGHQVGCEERLGGLLRHYYRVAA